jgi:hydrogenase expression/formation protein HypE
LNALDNPFLRSLGDSASLPPINGPLAMTTDSYVVSPLFFPGGDIGRLAVFGTINDLAVSGARPLYVSLALILEEGLPLDILHRVLNSVRDAAQEASVVVVTGDTKVVPRGAADGLFVCTTGIGQLLPEFQIEAGRVRPGDSILISGTVGDHGISVLAVREGFGFEPPPKSDVAPLHEVVQSLADAGIDVHFMRDPTRGGVAAVLHELTECTGLSVVVEETAVPISASVRGACELLGLDPLHVANEGKLLAVVASTDAERALACLRRHPLGRGAAVIGEIITSSTHDVLVRGPLGALRVLDEPSGAPLPRIC